MLLYLSEDLIFHVFADFGFVIFIPHTASPLVYVYANLNPVNTTNGR